MKKLIILLLTVLFLSCDNQDDECYCYGKFKLNYEAGPTFNVWDKVECETGEPFLSMNAEGIVEYLGCDDSY